MQEMLNVLCNYIKYIRMTQGDYLLYRFMLSINIFSVYPLLCIHFIVIECFQGASIK